MRRMVVKQLVPQRRKKKTFMSPSLVTSDIIVLQQLTETRFVDLYQTDFVDLYSFVLLWLLQHSTFSMY